MEFLCCADGKWGFWVQEGFDSQHGVTWTTSIPDLLQRYGLERFDFLKMDIESAEYEVFKDSEELPWLRDTYMTSMEVHGKRKGELIASMRARGLFSFKHGELNFFINPFLAITNAGVGT